MPELNKPAINLPHKPGLFSSMFPFDFRGELDQMDLLKQLPMQPSVLAAGQLLLLDTTRSATAVVCRDVLSVICRSSVLR